ARNSTRYLESLTQDTLAIGIATASTVQVREIHIGREKQWIQTNLSLQLLLAFHCIAPVRIESSDVNARLRPVGVLDPRYPVSHIPDRASRIKPETCNLNPTPTPSSHDTRPLTLNPVRLTRLFGTLSRHLLNSG